MRTVRGRHYAKFYSRSHGVVIRVYDDAGQRDRVRLRLALTHLLARAAELVIARERDSGSELLEVRS
jgi:hypothetical protein